MPDAHEGMVDNKYLYNDKELFDDGDLGWLDYGFRNYDAQIGRFVEIDPLTDDYPMLSGYHYGLNDPIGNIDEYGLSGVPITAAQKAAGYTLEGVVVTSSKSFLQKVGSFINKGIKTAGKMLEDGIEHVGAAALGAANAWSSNQVFGIGRINAKEHGLHGSLGFAFQVGQKFADAYSFAAGIVETGGASVLTYGSGGAAAPITLPVALHGLSVTITAGYHLWNDKIVYSTGSEGTGGSSAPSPKYQTPNNSSSEVAIPKDFKEVKDFGLQKGQKVYKKGIDIIQGTFPKKTQLNLVIMVEFGKYLKSKEII
jgi:RHS repeat-associated protein